MVENPVPVEPHGGRSADPQVKATLRAWFNHRTRSRVERLRHNDHHPTDGT